MNCAMTKKEIKRVIRPDNLSPEEVARDEALRRNLGREFPPTRPLASNVADSISQTLKRAVQQSDRPVQEICKEAGVSSSMLAEFLADERDIPTAVADRLAGVLGLKLTVG